ncbi:MAG: hypothetical protein WD115_01165 [Balneolaceae bacterium]
MSYGLRNSLILLSALILIGLSGFLYHRFQIQPALEELRASVEEQNQIYEQMSDRVELYPVIEQNLERARQFVDGFGKALFPTHNPDQIYRYLIEINSTWPNIDFDYQFQDSTQTERYGIVQSSVSGEGEWRSVFEFIQFIEQSRPVQKIDNIQITPVNLEDAYERTRFTFTLSSYYARTGPFVDWEDLTITLNEPDHFSNPYYPLVRTIPPNEEQLVDVEQSRLIGVSTHRVFLRDQNGVFHSLEIGDRVWLGELTGIDINQRQARFRLNKGGLMEEILLEVTS